MRLFSMDNPRAEIVLEKDPLAGALRARIATLGFRMKGLDLACTFV